MITSVLGVVMEEITVRFNNFNDEIFKSIGREEFCDVTLVGDDKIPVKAHKFILASSSIFFRDLFENHQQSEAVVQVEGTNNQDIQDFLYVIYNRNTQGRNVDISRVLQISKYLHIDFLPEVVSIPEEKHNPPDENHTQKSCLAQFPKVEVHYIDIESTKELEDFDAELFEKCIETGKIFVIRDSRKI